MITKDNNFGEEEVNFMPHTNFTTLCYIETEDSYLLSLSLSSDNKGKVSLTDVTFTPMWTHRYTGENGATFVVLPVDNTEQLEEQTGITGIKEQADESAARTQAIIGDGVEKVKASLPLKSAL